MATIRKRGEYSYEAQIRRLGYPAITKTFTFRLDAEKWARQMEGELDRGLYLPRHESEKTIVADLVARFETNILPKKRSTKHFAPCLARINEAFGKRAVATISSQDVAGWRDKRLKTVSPSTVRKELAVLSKLLDLGAKEWGVVIPANPVKMVSKPSEPRGRERRLRTSEEKLLKAACKTSENSSLEPLMELAIETAMRLGELLSLRWEHVDLRNRTAHLPITKNGEARDVPLSTTAVSVFRKLKKLPRAIDGRVFGSWARADSFTKSWSRTVSKARKSYEEECGKAKRKPDSRILEDLHFHDLRHEATSRLAEKLDTHELARVTGHKSLQMLMRYYHPHAADLAKKLG